MRQAGRYMSEYRAVRKEHSLLEICKKPALAAEVTITAAEILGVDAAIIFADLLLPLEVMGLPFHFSAGEGPVIEKPVRSTEDIAQLRTDRAADLGYVSEAVALVAKHFADRVPVIGFCGAPFTLASYMIEGGGSRNYVHAKKMMYNAPRDWDALMSKLVEVTASYSADQVRAGADAIQIFDSWVGCLSVEDYRRYVLPHVYRHGEAPAEDWRAHHLFRHRQLDASARHERNWRRSDRPRLAHSARRRLAAPRSCVRGAGQPRSRAALRRLEGIEVARARNPAPRRRTTRPHL